MKLSNPVARECGADLLDRAEALKDSVERLQARATEAIEDGADAVRRSTRSVRHQALDARDDAKYRIKKRPFAAVAVAFGLGAVIGVGLGLLGRTRSV